jgi:hypothetical protein
MPGIILLKNSTRISEQYLQLLKAYIMLVKRLVKSLHIRAGILGITLEAVHSDRYIRQQYIQLLNLSEPIELLKNFINNLYIKFLLDFLSLLSYYLIYFFKLAVALNRIINKKY